MYIPDLPYWCKIQSVEGKTVFIDKFTNDAFIILMTKFTYKGNAFFYKILVNNKIAFSYKEIEKYLVEFAKQIKIATDIDV